MIRNLNYMTMLRMHKLATLTHRILEESL